jgi:probable HAF family extracellular repeat protein
LLLRALVLGAGLTAAVELLVPAAGSAQASKAAQFPYTIVDLGTFGGPNGFQNAPGRSLTNNGSAIGEADTATPDPNAPLCFSDCFISPGFEWEHGQLTNLGALPGPNSSCPTWINDRGLITGVSEYAVDQAAGVILEKAVLWRNGGMVDLGTLGGDQSDAGAVNNRGQVVGTALNDVPDPVPGSAGPLGLTNCAIPPPFNTTEARAYLWQDGVMHDLGTLGGPDASANLINDRGQVTGASFTNAVSNPTTGIPTTDPFLWQRGTMIDLGTLGGTFGSPNWLTASGIIVGTSNLAGDDTHHAFLWNGTLRDLGTLGGPNSEAFFANNAGEVVGRADFSPSDPHHHAFLWQHGTMIDLGTLPGGANSTAYGINARGQVIGDSNIEHGWLWQDGQIHDLNTLVTPGSGITVAAAAFINDSGEIYGTGVLPNGDQHVILLIPNKSIR